MRVTKSNTQPMLVIITNATRIRSRLIKKSIARLIPIRLQSGIAEATKSIRRIARNMPRVTTKIARITSIISAKVIK